MDPPNSITNCVLLSRPEDGVLFDFSGSVRLDGYAVIPLDLFDAMGGVDHPAYREAVSRRYPTVMSRDQIAVLMARAAEKDAITEG